MISLVLFILASFFNAVMDRLENENFFYSVFSGYNVKFWYKRESWKSCKRILGYKIDAWHLAKSMMIICLSAAVVLYNSLFGIIDFVVLGLCWNISFNLFYNHLLKR